MICAAAREIKDGEKVFVGIGLPILASMLAQRIHAPNVILVFESGIIGSKPTRIALSIADPGLVTGSDMLVDFFDVFTMVLQNGNVDLGFVGGAQVDRYGNVNSTMIGDYKNPAARFPGGGGAYDMTMAGRTMIVMAHEKRRFVPKVDFVTTPGHMVNGRPRADLGILGGGPSLVVSSKGTLRFDSTGEMFLESYFRGTSPEEIKENTGWDLKISPKVKETPKATNEELSILRKLDPGKLLLK